MDRVQRNVSISIIECNLDHNKVVNMVKILLDLFLGMLWTAIWNDKVSRRTDGYFVCNVSRKDELTLGPANINLENVST